MSVSLAALGSEPQPAQSPRELVQTYLRDVMDLTADEVAAVNAGEAVAKTMATAEPQDVGIIGAVRIGVPAAALIHQLSHIEVFDARAGVLQIGRFHELGRVEHLS